MRSLLRDAVRTIPVTTFIRIPNAASGNGQFSDGTPWSMVRATTGDYEIKFDPRLIPVSGSVGLGQNARITASFGAMGPGSVFIHGLLFDGTAVNFTFDLNLNLLDTRT